MSWIADFVFLFLAPERRAWRGKAPLGNVFWGYGVGLSLVIAGLYAIAMYQERLDVQQGLILFSAAYTVWIVVAIWRSAVNSDPFWGTLARWLTVTWALNASLVLISLQLELVLRYARG